MEEVKEKEELPQLEEKENSRLSEIFDWKMLMSVRGDGTGIYYTRTMPHPKSGYMQLAKLDMSKKVIAHQNDVRPLEYYLGRNAGRFFDIMHENYQVLLSLDNAAITATEELNKLMESEYQAEVKEVKAHNAKIEKKNGLEKEDSKLEQIKPLPVKPREIQMYDCRRFVKWYVFINQVLAEMTAKQAESKPDTTKS